MRTVIFIDYWNFQLNWNEKGGGVKCDWPKIGPSFRDEIAKIMAPHGFTAPTLEAIRIYASVLKNDESGKRTTDWMNRVLKRIPGVSVFIRERQLRTRPVRCRECGKTTATCPSCSHILEHAPEKGVDSAIVADMLSLAWDGAYDLAVIVSQDADFVPAVRTLMQKGIKVVNAGWSAGGNDLAQECWGSFAIEKLAAELARAPEPTPPSAPRA